MLMSDWLRYSLPFRSVLFCCKKDSLLLLRLGNVLFDSCKYASKFSLLSALCFVLVPRPVVLYDLQSSSKRGVTNVLHSILLSAVLPILSSSAHPVAVEINLLALICHLSSHLCLSCSSRLSRRRSQSWTRLSCLASLQIATLHFA